MPTASKLVAALILALTGYGAAVSVIPVLPEAQPKSWLIPVCVLVPMVVAWRIMGRLVGRTYGVAVSSGLYAVAAAVVCVVGIFAIAEMIKRSTRLRYDDVMEALIGAIGLFGQYLSLLLHPPVLVVLAVGAVVVGLGAEWSHRRWR